MQLVIFILLQAALCVIAVGDMRRRIIPNAMVLLVLGLALALRISLSSLGQGLGDGLISMALVAGPAIALFFLRVWGGGDAKLLIALSAGFAPRDLPDLIVLIAVIGGIQAVVALIIMKLAAWQSKQPGLPYGLALALGGGVAFILHGVAA